MNALKRTYLYPLVAFISWFATTCEASAQTHRLNIAVSGDSSYTIPYATVKLQQEKLTTDSLGQLAVDLPSGIYALSISAVGYYNETRQIRLYNDTTLQILLRTRQSMLGNVTVSANRHVVKNQMSVQSINIEQLKKLPVILGEIDPLKTITLLPGIKSGGEASAGIYVRGGGPDQNLILLDGIPVYNPNHLLGFFSIFNGEAIRNIEVIKGGMPAEYGGRLSSVINVETRSGNKDSIKGSGGIGLISSRLSVEGPLVKGRSGFIISARRTYIDQVGRLVAKSRIGDNGYYFYDINAKADYVINKNNTIDLTFYNGTDDFSYVDNDDNDGRDRYFNGNWGNTLVGLSLKQQVNKKLKHDFSAIYNQFNLDSRITYATTTFAFASGLKDYQLKSDWTYNVRSFMKWKWGAQYIWHNFRPGAGGVTSGIQEFKSQLNDQYAREAAAYFSTDIRVSPTINIIAGLRYSYFNQVGPTEQVIYDADGVPTGEVQRYERGESIAKYHYPEPRVNLLYRLNATSSLKASYTRTVQYLHLATTSAATFPSDLWVPSSRLIRPGIAAQVALGYFRDINNGVYEFSAEAYYKTMSNQLEFRPGAQLLLNQNIEGEMIFGTGKAYGLELFLQKKQGQFTGWIGYTISRTERTFPDLNEGRAFPYRYDRTHDLSLVANYRLSPKWEASGVFVYGTGNALTMPVGRFTYNVGYDTYRGAPIFTNVNQYSGINDYRMPAYHRMDIAFTYTPKPDSKKRFKSSWNFSLYNLYNRYNPYFIYLDTDDSERTIQGKKVFLFPIIPGVTWNFKF
ncbi:TonB-dependent receptor [Terrimonas sp. NA20]|uniref:TonB-dependent receptor n=1 Tax=Terrimonas ginsenosidimutans TaxID=2908004 RepID=A0ABS9KYW2_9BACT|nr:TonB-dependent receptor [Terrimonas ginsenosidimutans]MCG2617510.1 TonB-dependent receptor [Terrimonas ginsenosidimutans]